MKRTLRNGPREITISSDPDARSDSVRFHDEVSAMSFIIPFVRDAFNMVSVRGLLADDLVFGSLSRLSDREVMRHLARRMVGGQISIIPSIIERRAHAGPGKASTPADQTDGKPAATDVAPPVEPEKEKTWVAIELLDEEGKPVLGEAYWVQTASGQTIKGKLGKDGKATIRGVDPGTCKVTFPDLDAKEWERA